jgi:hypothetical protein
MTGYCWPRAASRGDCLGVNDIPAFLDLKQNGETFGRMICDQFDGLYEDGAKTGRVMAISLHPFLIGHPQPDREYRVWHETGLNVLHL